MPPPLIIEVIGDTSTLERSFKKTAAAAKQFSGTVKDQASRAIVANVEQRQSLEKLAAEYRLVARNAKQGSDVQVTAARLAANAERQLASSFGAVGRETRRSAGGFTLLHGEVGKASRGALAGSGVFRGLGRSIAFASGGFLAFATAGDFLRKSIDAAKEAQVTQKQLAAQFRASGQDLGQYRDAIEKTTNRLSLLAGFQNDELKAGFITIFRATGNASKALRDLGLAADIARAKHKDLSFAATLVAKVEAGNTGLLRRQGVQLAKNVTVEQALTVARAKFAGQARAGTTAQERFGAVLHNTEEIIGTALLPTLNKYLTSLAKWLTKMNESGRLQRDVESATKTLSAALAGIKAVVVPLADAFKTLASAVGGTRNAIKLLAETVVLLKLSKLVTGITGIGAAAGEAGAAGQVALLTSRLKLLGALAAIPITITIVEKFIHSKFGKAIGGDFSGIDLAKDIGKVFGIGGGGPRRDGGLTLGDLAGIQGTMQARRRLTLPSASGVGASPLTLTTAQRRAIDLAGDPSLQALRAQRDFDKTQLAALQKRFVAGRVGAKAFTAATIRLRNDLAQQESAITSILNDQAQKVAEGARKAAAERKAAAAKIRKARELMEENARVFAEGIFRGVKLGVDTKTAGRGIGVFAAPLGLQLTEARTAAQGGDLKPVLEKLKAAALKALRSGKLAIQGRIDAWNEIGRINDQLKGAATGDVTKFKHLSSAAFVKSLGQGFTREQVRAIRAGFVQVGAGGTVPQRTPQFAGAGGGTVFTGPNHFHGITDMRKFEAEVEKRKRSRPVVRRGAR